MTKQKIKLEICCGTTCYMLGGAKLLLFSEQLPEHWKPWLEISACPCMEACTRDDIGNAPFVSINGVRYGNASPDSVYETLEGLFREMGVTAHE